jgi:hypothetical protein
VSRFWEDLWQRRTLRLRTYDPGRGRLAAYLNHLVRWLVLRFWQERGRREKEPLEERIISSELPAPPDPCYPEGLFRDDVSTLLTPQERRYFEYLCTAAAADLPCPFSDTSRWKFHHNVRQKAGGLLGLR